MSGADIKKEFGLSGFGWQMERMNVWL